MLWIVYAVAALAVIYYYLSKPLKYWKNVGVKQTNPTIIFGDFWGAFSRKQSLSETIRNVYNMAPKARYIGMYQMYKPTLMLKDPELIKQICVKDFENFMDHRNIIPEDCDPLWGKTIFSLTGKKWKDMRATLSPTFTSSKMRSMFVLMTESSESFTKYFIKQKEPLIEIEMKEAFTRYATDVVASIAFGIKIDSLENKENEFYLMSKQVSTFSFVRLLKVMGFLLVPSLLKRFRVSMMGSGVTEFFLKIVRESIKAREENHIVRPDMMHLLIKARKGDHLKQEEESIDTGFAIVEESNIGKAKVKIPLDDNDIAAQALGFFFAGFDSISSLLCFTLYELVVNPDIQDRLREEVEKTLKQNDGKINYEALLGMKYLDMVLTEGLRKWPSAVSVDRVCTTPYTIEPKYPDETAVHLKVNDLLLLPILGMHRNPKYFPNPDKFDPERFNEENKCNIRPYTFIPFGVGPRNCVGSRLALLETKAVLLDLLHHFEIVPTEKTKIPLEVSKKTFSLTAEGGFWFGLKRIEH